MPGWRPQREVSDCASVPPDVKPLPDENNVPEGAQCGGRAGRRQHPHPAPRRAHLAERAGRAARGDVPAVQQYEGGVSRVGAGRLARIAAALGVPVAALLGGVEGVRDERAPAGSALAMIAEPQPYRLAAAYARIPDKGVVVLVAKLARGRGG